MSSDDQGQAAPDPDNPDNQTDPSAALPDEMPEESDAWRATNGYALTYDELRRRLQELRDGWFRLLIICGPPQINKTGTIKDFLGDVYREGVEEWNATDAAKRPSRRTTYDAIGNAYYDPPFQFLGGEIQPPFFFEYLHKTSSNDEYLVLDDCTSLNIYANRSMLQQAADSTREGTVSRLTNAVTEAAKKGGLSPTVNHHGKIIIVTNAYRDTKDAGLLFGESLQTKARWIEFPTDLWTLVEYVDRTAFVSDPNKGLYAYLLAPRSLNLPEDDRGLEYLGEHPSPDLVADRADECLAILVDVRAWFLFNAERWRFIGYRTLRQLLMDRVRSPATWQADSKSLMKPIV